MWFKDSIVYHILIDRFAGYDTGKNWQKPVFTGGNIKGVIEKLPYLQDLGINTIWLSPINKTNAYHGYHITDFYAVEPRFGTDRDLSSLIAAAHRINIRIILDFVPNHCSVKHPFFQKALKDRKSKYRKWFCFTPWSNKYMSFLDFKELPKINLDYADAREHIINAALYWLKKGIDGFRLDHVIGPGHDFWKEFSLKIKRQNSDAVLIGEAWMEGIKFIHLKTISIRNKYLRWLHDLKPQQIQREYIGELDGVLDFFFRKMITHYIAWKDNPDHYQHRLVTRMKEHFDRFPDSYHLPSFVDNHDMSRFIYEAGQNKEKLKKALKIQFELPQPPILYYGTETALSHDAPVNVAVPYSDLQARRFMPWDSLDKEMVGFCKDLIAQRKRLLKNNYY